MKFGNTVLEGPNQELLVIPRPTGNLVVKAQTVTSYKEFEALVPVPKPGGIRTKEGFKEDREAPDFLTQVENYDNLKFAYMVLKSIEPSEIAFEKTKMQEPSTWLGWAAELQEAGLSEVETNRIVVTVLQANSLDEAKMQAARDAFLSGAEE